MKSRVIITFFVILVLGMIVLLRAAWLQFIPHDKLNALKNRQFQTVVTLPSRRGAILDRNGKDLAVSTAAFSLYADPKVIKRKREVARKLAQKLGLSYDFVYGRIKDSNRRFSWIQRRMERQKMEDIQALKISGLAFVEEWKRVYPNENLMSQVLGFLGNEGQGLEGLELQFEDTLHGNQKKVLVKRDARGRPLVADGLLFTENPEGHEIHLTVDSELQYHLENELQRALEEFEADSAMGIILDARTSAIRAMANIGDSNIRNRTVTDFFEPGSVIKPFVIAKGMKDQNLQPNSKFFCEMGEWKIGNRTIRESDSNHKYGFISITEILAYSSNIGTGKIALSMGSEKVKQGLEEFGFGQKTSVDLPGEVKGVIQPLPWNQHLTANVSFGQGMTATMLQVANAYAVLANGGLLKTPYIVEKIRSVEDGEEEIVERSSGKRVLSAQQAESMRMILTAVTQKEATGFKARVPGFQVAGKTGTAQKASATGRGYLPRTYIASFAGMIPAHKPEYVIYVAVDHPKKSFYASLVAAPLFSRVASFAVRKSGLAPSLLASEDYQPKTVLESHDSNPQASILRAGEIMKSSEKDPMGSVPELKNLTLREAIQKIQGQELKIKTIGEGKVIETFPKSGEPLGEEGQLTIILQ